MVGVSSGALVLNSTRAWALICVPVASAGLGLDGVGDEAFARAAGVVGRQQAQVGVGDHLAGQRVDGLEQPGDGVGLNVDAGADARMKPLLWVKSKSPWNEPTPLGMWT